MFLNSSSDLEDDNENTFVFLQLKVFQNLIFCQSVLNFDASIYTNQIAMSKPENCKSTIVALKLNF